MSDQLQLRGGSTAESQAFVGAEREVTVDTGLKTLRIHDGVTAGGHLIELAAAATTARDTVSSDAATALENVRAALQQAIDDAIVARDAAIAAGDSATLTSANSYTDTKVTEVLGGAPDLLDTLNELAAAVGDDADFITTINSSIEAVQADVDANEAALQAAIDAVQTDVDANETAANTAIADGDAATLTSANTYTDTAITNLTNGADAALDTLKEIGDALAAGDQSVTDALTTSITTESTTRAAADTALSDRLDVLEADPVTAATVTSGDASTLASANSYTDSQVAAGDATVTTNLTALVTTETNARAAADTALSDRLTVLEADPTTATALTTAVAGVQADVDQNEADSDAAISAEETRALAAEAAITAAHTAEEAARDQLNLHAGLAFGQLYVGDLVVA